MFGKKFQCPRCGEKVSNSYSFCPHCGGQLRELEAEEKDKQRGRQQRGQPDNLFDALDENFKMPFLLRFPFKKLVKEIEQQFMEMDKSFSSEEREQKNKKSKSSPLRIQPPSFSQGISISIGGSPDGKPVIRVKQFGPGMKNGQNNPIQPEQKTQAPIKKELTKSEEAKLKKFAKLPREEPETNIRRLSDRIIYEILIPGIKDKRNIIINKLQNSIEIKAFTKDKAYFKLIPLSLPIKRHYLENEKLILELNPQA